MAELITPQQRDGFAKAGWTLYAGWNAPRDAEWWMRDKYQVTVTADREPSLSAEDGAAVPLSVTLEVAAIMGTTPTGTVLVPVETIHRAVTELRDRRQFRTLDEWAERDAIATALSTTKEEVPKGD